jgi:hypothetical protein
MKAAANFALDRTVTRLALGAMQPASMNITVKRFEKIALATSEERGIIGKSLRGKHVFRSMELLLDYGKN